MQELQMVLPIGWSAERQRWDALLERQENERASFIRDLAEGGATQQEIADNLGLKQSYVSRLLSYGAVMERLMPTGINTPTERELRPTSEQAAEDVAEARA